MSEYLSTVGAGTGTQATEATPSTRTTGIIRTINEIVEVANSTDSVQGQLDTNQWKKLNQLDMQLGEQCKELGLTLPKPDNRFGKTPEYRDTIRFFENSQLPYQVFPGPRTHLAVSAEWLADMDGLRAKAEYRISQIERGTAPPCKLQQVVSGELGLTTNNAEPGANESLCALTDDERKERIRLMKPSHRKAYFAFEYAQTKAGKKLEDRDAYNLLKEQGISANAGDQGELTDYELPAFDTWARQLRTARNALGESKYTRRKGRSHGSSIVRQDEIEQSENDE